MSNFIAKTTSIAGLIAILLCAPTAQSQSEVPSPQELKPILGIVTPNKTTLSEVESALKEKGCGFEAKTVEDGSDTEKGISVDQGCFHLPGSPSVIFASISKNESVDGVLMLFKEGGTKQMFHEYLQSLTKSYGDPTDVQQQFLWNTYYWPKMKEKFFVSFVGSEMAGPFMLVYSIGPGAKVAYDKWQEILKKQEPTKVEETGKDINNL